MRIRRAVARRAASSTAPGIAVTAVIADGFPERASAEAEN
jgi:hypothetical protein